MIGINMILQTNTDEYILHKKFFFKKCSNSHKSTNKLHTPMLPLLARMTNNGSLLFCFIKKLKNIPPAMQQIEKKQVRQYHQLIVQTTTMIHQNIFMVTQCRATHHKKWFVSSSKENWSKHIVLLMQVRIKNLIGHNYLTSPLLQCLYWNQCWVHSRELKQEPGHTHRKVSPNSFREVIWISHKKKCISNTFWILECICAPSK